MAQAKKAPLKDVMGQVQPMIESVAGFVVGNMAIGMLSKALKVDPADTSKNIKKVLPPLAVATGAMFGATKVKQPLIKNVLQGAAIAGAYKTAKALMPNAAFLNGDGLGLTPVSAVSNSDRWLYQENTPVSGIGFPDLGEIQPPQNGSGYYLDAPAYLQGGEEEQVYGSEDDLNGAQGDSQVYGDIDLL
jgi:hypothetical protein